MDNKLLSKLFLLFLVILISLIFFTMIRHLFITILLAGIFSAMAQPVYKYFMKIFNSRPNLSSALTLSFILLVIFLPLMALFGIVAGQAVKISNTVKPWVEQRLEQPSAMDAIITELPFSETLIENRDFILQKTGELVGKVSTLLFNNLSSMTLSTVNFVFLFFIFLYTMFFFLKEGNFVLDKILYYMPLSNKDERRMLDKFTSVTRATIKGTLFIGVIQGSLAGISFWVVGIESALFWGTIMTVLSIIPAVGSALVWFPAVIILGALGHYAKAIGLWIFCGLLVGSVDNILRPRLVGKDTKMHELLIFFGTIGGLSLFGIVGFIIGPVIAALFVTVWEIYGVTFKDYLPEVREKPPAVPDPEIATSKKDQKKLMKENKREKRVR